VDPKKQTFICIINPLFEIHLVGNQSYIVSFKLGERNHSQLGEKKYKLKTIFLFFQYKMQLVGCGKYYPFDFFR